MTVYVDPAIWPYGRMKMCHMTADTLTELHAVAASIGIARRWFQCPPKASMPHYDICKSKRALAISLGAVEVTCRGGVIAARRLLVEWRELEASL